MVQMLESCPLCKQPFVQSLVSEKYAWCDSCCAEFTYDDSELEPDGDMDLTVSVKRLVREIEEHTSGEWVAAAKNQQMILKGLCLVLRRLYPDVKYDISELEPGEKPMKITTGGNA